MLFREIYTGDDFSYNDKIYNKVSKDEAVLVLYSDDTVFFTRTTKVLPPEYDED